MSWEKVKIKEIWKGFYDGPHATPPVSDCGGIFLGISNITPNGHIDLSDIKYISEQDLPKWTKRVVPQGGDIVFSYEATLNLYAIIPENFYGCLGRRMALIRVDENKISNKFLYYYFFSDEWRATIAENTIVGATVDRIPIAKFPEFPISLPSLKEQKRIADILSAYDDLIENNQKQIKLLEEAAQRLYKQWFIDLRYPGHETTPIVDGLPKGWRKDRADSFFNITIGKTPPRAEKQWFTEDGNGIPWISISDMGTDSAFLFETSEGLTLEAIQRHNVKVVPANTVLLSFKLTVGRVSITTTEMCTNEAIAHFVTDDDSIREYAYCYLKNFHYDELGSTSSISKAINSKIVKAMPFVMPSDDIVKAFHKVMNPIFEQIFTKQKQIQNLSQSRDRLLPKLMNGELEV